MRYTISEAARQEVLARLLKINHERYAEEVAQGLHEDKKQAGNKRPKSKPADRTLFDGEEKEETEDENSASAEIATEKDEETDVHDAEGEQAARPRPIEDFDTDEIMASFRQSARGQGWQGREELLKAVSLSLGYQRVGTKVREALKGHLRAAIRRKIIEAEGDQVRVSAASMDQYELEDLRSTLCSVMKAGRRYEREEVVQAVARYLGFVRVTDTVLQSLKSAINSGIRQGVLGYEGSVIWRQQ